MSERKDELAGTDLEAENQRLRQQLEAREAELAVINSIQEGLASDLDLETIFDLVGERIAEIFAEHSVAIFMLQPDNGLVEAKYLLENGVRHRPDPVRPGPIGKRLIEDKKPLMILTPDEFQAIGAQMIEGTAESKSGIYAPLIIKNEVIGSLHIESPDRERAFDYTDFQLVTTVANALSVALQNAHLFDETQRLLQDAEERAAELALINAVQRALAAELDIDSIYEAVGEELRSIFDTQIVTIASADFEKKQMVNRYAYEKGRRLDVPPVPLNSMYEYIAARQSQGEPFLINENFPEFAAQFEDYRVPQGEMPVSVLAVAIPRSGQTKTLEAITLQDVDGDRVFTDADVRLLETLAGSMSVALENARLFAETQRLLEETEQRASELQIINSVQEGLASKLDMEEIYELVGNKLREIFDADTIFIAFKDLEANEVYAPYYSDRGQVRTHWRRSYGEGGMFETIVESGEPVMINTPEELAEWDLREIPSPGSDQDLNQSVLTVPIFREGEAVGVTSVQSYDPHAFDPNDQTLLQTLTNSMSVALESARLFDETQRLLEETEQRAAELQLINSVQAGLASKLDMQSIYELVGDKIREIFQADTTFIAFHDAERGTLVSPYYNDRGKQLSQSSRPYGRGLAEYIIESGQPRLLNTSEEMKESGSVEIASPGSDRDLNESFLGAPILRDGVAIGAASVQSYQRFAFDQNDLTLLQTLTNSMSVALESARLFDETQHLLQETEQRAAELATINAVGQALVAETELAALIELIGEQVRVTFEADIVYVATLDASSGLIRFPYSYGENFEPLQLGEGLTSKILETGEPLLINQEMDRRRAELGVERVGKRALSYLGVPIQMGGQTFGVISAQSTREEGRFNKADLRLLNTIAANVGTAIRNAQLFDEIKRQKQYYQAVIENSPAAIVLLDSAATVTGWNPAAERLFGYEQAEALGRNIDSLVAAHEEIREEAVDYSQRVMQEKEISRLTRRTRKDGSLVEVDLAGVPVSVDGEYVGFVAIYHDVTELQRARRQAEQANKAKSTFLANMSHELRTPLNAIIGFTRIVRRTGEGLLPEKQVENLDKVLVSADHLLELINTVLDISKIEAGRMQVKPTSFELAPVIEVVLTTTQPLLQEGVELIADLGEGLPALYSDKEKVRQILINLLSNAAKFTHEGEISLTARQRDDSLQIDVSDTGIGIAPEDLEIVFEEFQQADSSTTREYGGTGLGLAISRGLARLLGGDLSASSIEGHGSTFRLTIPVQYGGRASEGEPTGEADKDGALAQLRPHLDAERAGRLLVVDDDPSILDLVAQLVEGSGFEIEAASDGREALERVRRQPPDLILLDLLMPLMDGFELIDTLRQEGRQAPIIVLTAKELTDEDLERLEGSVERILQKEGTDRDELLAELRRTMGALETGKVAEER